MDQDKRMELNEPIADIETAKVEGGADPDGLLLPPKTRTCEKCNKTFIIKFGPPKCPYCGEPYTPRPGDYDPYLH